MKVHCVYQPPISQNNKMFFFDDLAWLLKWWLPLSDVRIVQIVRIVQNVQKVHRCTPFEDSSYTVACCLHPILDHILCVYAHPIQRTPACVRLFLIFPPGLRGLHQCGFAEIRFFTRFRGILHSHSWNQIFTLVRQIKGNKFQMSKINMHISIFFKSIEIPNWYFRLHA